MLSLTLYMRVLRRIADKVRFDATCDCSDHAVRQMLSQPSIDCLVQRQRLHYLARIVLNRPRALWAILQSTPGKQQLPWTAQVVADLQVLYANVGAARVNLPAPSDDGQAWLKFLIQKSQPNGINLLTPCSTRILGWTDNMLKLMWHR